MKPATDTRACTLLTIVCFALTLANGWMLAQLHLERERAADDRYAAERLVETATKLHECAMASHRSYMSRVEFGK